MKRNAYAAAAASVVLMAGGPVAAAAAAPADTARTAPAAVVPQGEVAAEAALAAALKNYPGVVESLDREANVWHVDVITKDGKGHAELDVDAATGAVTRKHVDTGVDGNEHKDLLAAEVTAEQAAKAALAARPGEVWAVEWDSADDGRAASWHVEVRSADGTTWDASVDPATGKATTRADNG